ncbi:MAG: hypothetical protein UZ14_CFX002002947 [Chloroflexi bacterium OLB14]|nr:MAG: hypothetical protein UZ14_CFX002002947 [Chloroflexi bacterium OLB14]
MKKEYFYIALTALLLPILVRAFWFYRGTADRPEIATPDYASFSAPQAPVNVSETDEEIKQLGGTVLIDSAHSNVVSMANIDSLISAIQARGGKIEMVADAFSLEYQLKYASAYITFSPTLPYSYLEIKALTNFANRGGKILAFSDATNNTIYVDYFTGSTTVFSDTNAVNTLLREFDITINNDYLYNTQNNEGNFRNVYFDEFGKSEITFGLTQIALYGTHSLESPAGTVLLQGAESNLSSSTDAHDSNQGGAVLSENGNVAAFGDATFLSSPYNTYTDNAKLINNLADFTLASKQTLTLQNLPYLFTNKKVSVYLASDLSKDTSLVTALGSLQSSLRLMNVEAEFVDSIPSSGDTIILSTFLMDEKTQALVNKFGIKIDFTITTTDFGEVSSGGTGLILFDSTNKGNTLILLAGSQDDLISLMSVASIGNINTCLSNEKMAVCSVGYGDSYSDDFYYEEPSFEETPIVEGEATPEATPTP